MGWKGTIRSLAAAARAAERESHRRRKINAKKELISAAGEAVEVWEEHIETLTTIYTDGVSPIDWAHTANLPEPIKPVLRSDNEVQAKAALDNFKPSFLDIFEGGSKRKLKRLQDALDRAPKLDSDEFDRATAAYLHEHAEWQSDAALATRVLSGEAAALKEVVEEITESFQKGLVGSAIEFKFGDNFVHAIPTVHTTEIVPSFRRKQLASGRLSESKMPAGQFNELYQDYVAGVALRVANDLFRVLPLDELYVTCRSEMLNTQTGYKEVTPILSTHFVRETFKRLNLNGVDASDALANFRHVVKFSRTKGFSRIDPILLERP